MYLKRPDYDYICNFFKNGMGAGNHFNRKINQAGTAGMAHHLPLTSLLPIGHLILKLNSSLFNILFDTLSSQSKPTISILQESTQTEVLS